ncbi:hypothetical protein H072_8401 [Dactylellina haptotyla CBS 200.50]|uniref:Glycoside hydrolase family 28 protein n=1 Tax=Dactylellina haptotyla (strain CBS 200.50) TaxID=1284197 RepID=S8BRS7_DACHA|nr:hypothetical protein H072_8401 [Dactylellina haptotyla CBS 200.50]
MRSSRSSLVILAISGIGYTTAQQTNAAVLMGQVLLLVPREPSVYTRTIITPNVFQVYFMNKDRQKKLVIPKLSALGTAGTTTTSKTTNLTTVAMTTSATGTAATTTKTTATPANPCLCTARSQITAAQSNCTTLTLSGINSPTSSSFVLNALKPSATVIFAGNDGNPKPGQFLKIQMTNSLFTDLYFLNFPTQGLNIASCSDTTFKNIYIDNDAGFAANSISNGLPAAHNTDGFNVGNSNNIVMNNLTVYGLSINGGGSSGTHITENITFKDFADIQNAAIDVEQNYGGGNPTNGVLIKGITYKNITRSVDSSAKVYNLVCGSGSYQDFSFSGIKVTGAGKANTCTNLACPS